MRKVGACFAIAALAAVIFSAAASGGFGLRIGPFHIGLPFLVPPPPSPLYMRAIPTRRAPDGQAARPAGPRRGRLGAALSKRAPARDFPEYLLADYSSPWPFGYEDIFSTAFARTPADQDPALCQQSFDANAIVGRIRAEIAPTPDQMQLLAKARRRARRGRRLSGKIVPERNSGTADGAPAAHGIADRGTDHGGRYRPPAAAGFRAIAQRRPEGAVRGRVRPSPATDQSNATGAVAPSCGGSPTAIDWSIDQIDRSVQPTDAPARRARRHQAGLRQGRERSRSALPDVGAADGARATGNHPRRGSTRLGARCCRFRSRWRISKPN